MGLYKLYNPEEQREKKSFRSLRPVHVVFFPSVWCFLFLLVCLFFNQYGFLLFTHQLVYIDFHHLLGKSCFHIIPSDKKNHICEAPQKTKL